VGQCQLILGNYEKNNKKKKRYGGLKGADLTSFILNIKKDFDHLFFISQY
jgi:hypothetical protein